MAFVEIIAATLSVACLLCVGLLLRLPAETGVALRATVKLGASSCFVVVAAIFADFDTRPDQLIVLALLWGWLGDALLLSRRAPVFMGGLAAFLVAHLLFAAAFVFGGLSLTVLPVFAGVAILAAAIVLRALLPHVGARFRGPVIAYVLTIVAMCVVAACHSQAGGPWSLLLAAALFATSDLAVARDRFIKASPHNKRWGLPLYYSAQLLFAWSLAP